MTRPKGVPSVKAPCRYCGRELSRMDIHERACIKNPTVRAAIVAALTSATPGEGVTAARYAARSSGDLSIPDVGTLRRATGARDWAGVLAEFGLVPQPVELTSAPIEQQTRAQKREAAVIAAIDAMSEAARQELASAYDAEHTCHGYAVRDLPGVTVNGRACVAVMLR